MPALLGHYSYSRVRTWHQCPAKWVRKYLLQEPETDSFESLVGKFVHEVLENVIPIASWDRPRTDNAGFRLLRKEAKRVWQTGEYAHALDSRRIFMFKLQSWELLTALRPSVIDDNWGINAVASEYELSVTAEFRNKKIPFLGYIDRVDERDGVVTLVDYKTGRMPASMYHDSAMRQLQIYAAAVRHDTTWPYGKPQVAKILYLGSGDALFHRITDSSIAEAEDWFLEGVLGIEQVVRQPRTELVKMIARKLPVQSHLCGWCSYESSCKAGQERPNRLRSAQHKIDITKIGERKK